MRTRNTNPQLEEMVIALKRTSRKNKARIWDVLADELCRSRRSRTAVNLGQIDRSAASTNTIAVPGKVLGSGNATRSITVGAFKFTEQARMKLEKAGGKCLSLAELAKAYPKGTNVKIVE